MKVLIGLALFLTAEIGIRVTCGVMTPLPAVLPQRSLDEIPKHAGSWNSEDLPIDKPLFEHTGAEVMLDRNYTNAIGDTISANFGIWIDSDIPLPHSPELCYSTAGWTIDDRKQVTVSTKQGNEQANLLTLSKEGQVIRVLYCYEFGDRTVLDSDELRKIRQSLRGSKSRLPPIVKMMLQSNQPSAASAERELIELAGFLMPTLTEYH